MLGDKVKELRKKAGLTQQQLANTIGVSRSAIGMLEKNLQGIGNESLLKLADFFDVTVDYLLSNKIVDTDINTDNVFSGPGKVIKDIDSTELSKKAERDIKKSLDKTLDMIEHSQDGLMFDGEPLELDDLTRELLKESLENSMRMAKKIAKEKYTPKKYKK